MCKLFVLSALQVYFCYILRLLLFSLSSLPILLYIFITKMRTCRSRKWSFWKLYTEVHNVLSFLVKCNTLSQGFYLNGLIDKLAFYIFYMTMVSAGSTEFFHRPIKWWAVSLSIQQIIAVVAFKTSLPKLQ